MSATTPVTTVGPAPGFAKRPDYAMNLSPAGSRVQVFLGGTLIADSTQAMVVAEGSYPPRYYLPLGDVSADALTPTSHSTHCPFKGDARYWTVSAGGDTVENGAWAYDAPFDEFAEAGGLISFYGEHMEIVVG